MRQVKFDPLDSSPIQGRLLGELTEARGDLLAHAFDVRLQGGRGVRVSSVILLFVAACATSPAAPTARSSLARGSVLHRSGVRVAVCSVPGASTKTRKTQPSGMRRTWDECGCAATNEGDVHQTPWRSVDQEWMDWSAYPPRVISTSSCPGIRTCSRSRRGYS